ncbi:diacylglycerol/lipid kinase family protein [Subtercola sp. RTI3]|uniref:diacylglycerol/lipid kinase family protein n=1 Tax=Subtercola sp. RTI3 TaxID=3048639 RepID=UPI002B2393BA|nr:diacylglycerol kinase family protein [Subtercola sp. RTI3]MEA9986721.1 diacylglycerol kinase family protein [Subtercola sp. RTI3]
MAVREQGRAEQGSSDEGSADQGSAGVKHAAVVYNPIKVDEEHLRSAVAERAAAAGWGETLWYETTVDDAGQILTGEAVLAGADVVMAAGGDGTVRAVAEALRGTGVPLALLPSGTGNLLARNLDMTMNFDEGIQLMFTGYDRAIDVGLIDIYRPVPSPEADIARGESSENEPPAGDTAPDEPVSTHVFLVIAGLGIDAKMIANTNSKLKKAVGWLAYVDGGLRAIPELRAITMKVSIDNEEWRSVSSHSVMAGNCGLLPGGLLLIPDARPDDGVLDFMALRPKGPFGWIRAWNKVAIENGVLAKSAAGRKIIELSPDVNDVIYRQGTDLRLDLDEPQEIQLDGDEFGRASQIHVWIDPAALMVRV